MMNDEESHEKDDGFFQEIPPGLFRMRSTCVRTGLHARSHADMHRNPPSEPAENPVGTFPDGRTGEYRHICRRFLHKILRKTSGSSYPPPSHCRKPARNPDGISGRDSRKDSGKKPRRIFNLHRRKPRKKSGKNRAFAYAYVFACMRT